MPINTIAIIPDGNRRYARKKRIDIERAYRVGINKIEEVCKWCKEKGIKNFIIWGFSTENWKRNKIERNLLFSLFKRKIKEALDTDRFLEEDIKVEFAGDLSKFPKYLKEGFAKLEEKTKKCKSLKLIICLNYGGKKEILNAVTKLINSNKKRISEREFFKYLWVKEEPELIIRTSGEFRLSGFLPFQSAYSELYFCKKFWPEFSKRDFEKALKEFEKRERRFGR